MKAMWMGIICAAAIAIIAGVVLNVAGTSTAQEYTAPSARI